MKKLLFLLLLVPFIASAQFIQRPTQGGTGLGSATVADINKCLVVSDDSPFTYIFADCATATGGFPSFLGQIGDVSTTTLSGGYVLKYSGTEWESVATSTLGLQEQLISGTNIKTINSTSILGSGDISISGGTVVGTLSTSTTPTLGQIPYWTSLGYPSLLGSVATTTIGADGTSISNSGTTGYQIGGTNNAFSLNMANPNTWTALQTFTNSSTTNTATIRELCFSDGQCMTSPTTVGSDITLFHWNDASEIATYERLRIEPDSVGVNIDESCAADADLIGGYCDIDPYVSTSTELALDSIQSGLWNFHYYTYANSTIDNSKLEATVFRRTSSGTETFMFQATSTDIQSTTITERQFSSTQSAFAFDPTDRLVVKVRAWTDSSAAKTIHFLYGGMTANYSHIETPISFGNFNFARKDVNETITGLWTFSNVGTTTFSGNVKIDGNLDVDGISLLSVVSSGNTIIGGTLGVTGAVDLDTYTSAILLTGATGEVAEYAGATCTNQFVRSLSALGAPTCATVGTADVSGLDISDDTNLAVTFPITLTGDTLGFLGLSTSTNPTVGRLAYWTNGRLLGDVATSSLAVGASITSSGTMGAQIGGTATTLSLNMGNANTWTAKQTFTNSSTTLGSFGTTLWIPIGATQTPTSAGEITIDTTSSQFKYFNGSAKVLGNGNQYATFSYATSSAWSATTTIPLGTARVGETWNDAQCFTDVGTLNVRFGDGTNFMPLFNASTTVGTVGTPSNNTFTTGEKRYVEVGTPATAPTKISCTVSKSITAD